MPEPAARHWTALAFDYGHKRIGVAAGDSVTRHARPLTTLECGTAGIDWPAIDHVINEWQPAILVVGVPFNADGSQSELANTAQDFARELGRLHQIRVDLVDERWSSLEAAQVLKSARTAGRRTRRVRREDVDAAAACVILERWFERSRSERDQPAVPR